MSAVPLDVLDTTLKSGIESGNFEPCKMEPVHLHPAGLYVRELTMPAGTILTSRVHVYEHLTVAMTGRCIVVDEHGNKREVVAPDRWITPAGTQRAIHVIEESRWLTVHATDETDPERLFNVLTCASMKEYNHMIKGEV
jgi:hypothetical protein